MSAAPLLPSLVGCTATGKTGVAVAVARELGMEIVSADSRQVYRRLAVGTAKPTADECAAAAHWMIDVADPEERYTAARFGEGARAAFGDIRGRGKIPFLVGGSGLYLRAAEDGLFEAPEPDPELRARIGAELERDGAPALHVRLAGVDPETAARVHPNDGVRVARALEVHAQTGVPLSEHHRRHREAASPVRTLRFGLAWPTLVLDRRIRDRVSAMLAAGWEEEVRGLVDDGLGGAPALSALGYPEMRELVAGRIGAETARERIATATRQFAKRQRTWFRAVPGITWIRADEGAQPAVERIVEAMREAAREAARKAGREAAG